MFYWKKIAAGCYEARRDGQRVALIERTKDDGAPIWELAVLDGTPLRKSAKGNVCTKFCTLGDARFAYGHAYRVASA